MVIDAYEQRDVAIFDVPETYQRAKFPDHKTVLMRLRNEFVDIMCDVNPEYKQHIRTIKEKKVLYLQVVRALYGSIESALLWYNLFSTTLSNFGFKINTYNRCVANKIENGKQLTIVWYVDDCKVSHEDPQVVSNIIDTLEEYYGDLKTTRGRKHTFLGIL